MKISGKDTVRLILKKLSKQEQRLITLELLVEDLKRKHK
jgi:hypothetical protein